MLQKIFKSGNSLSISIPAKFVKAIGLKAGEHVNLDMDYFQKTITLSFPDSGQMTLILKT